MIYVEYLLNLGVNMHTHANTHKHTYARTYLLVQTHNRLHVVKFVYVVIRANVQYIYYYSQGVSNENTV